MRIRLVWGSLAVLLALALTVGSPVALAGGDGGHGTGTKKMLTNTIEYWFVGHEGVKDEEGRTLVWKANIEGDLNGTAEWWFGPAPPAQDFVDGRISYYAGVWKVFDDEGRLLLAGESAGKTVFEAGADGIWDGAGVVTKARKQFRRYKGRPIYETGPVSGSFPDFYGIGMFVIH